MSEPEQLAADLWTWSGRRQGLPATMRSYLLVDGDETILVDPLASSADTPALLAALDELAGGRVRILVTTPLHTRGSGVLWERWHGDREVSIHGHHRVASRLEDSRGLVAARPGEELDGALDGGQGVLALGRPPRPEQPWHLAGHRALAFGDTVVEVDGELRVWPRLRPDALARGTYEQKLLPTLRAMADLAVDRILVTHGNPVLADGAAELRRACDRPIWKRAELY